MTELEKYRIMYRMCSSKSFIQNEIIKAYETALYLRKVFKFNSNVFKYALFQADYLRGDPTCEPYPYWSL